MDDDIDNVMLVLAILLALISLAFSLWLLW
jgi:hypothetical protein